MKIEARKAKPFPLKFPRKEPRVLLCRVCGKKVVEEPKSFIAIRGGGVVLEDEALQAYGPSDSARGFLHFFWYGDCSRDPEPQVPDATVLPVVHDAVSGQFEIRICSFVCLRRFFSSIERELKTSISKATTKPLALKGRKRSTGK